METKTALGAAGGIALTIAGAVTALVLTVGGGNAGESPEPAEAIVEYVDQYGNAVDPTHLSAEPAVPEIIVTSDAPADAVMAAGDDPVMTEAPYVEPEGAEPEYEDDEYGEAEEEEDD